MAKRFTDSDKWKRPWFLALPPHAKWFWLYMLDNCDSTGVWMAAFALAEFHLGYSVSESQIQLWYGDKIIKIDDDKFFIPSFVEFQYGELNPQNNAHKPVLKLIEKLGAKKLLTSPLQAPAEDLISPLEGAQDKDKDKDNCIKNSRAIHVPEFIHPARKLEASLSEDHQKIRAAFESHGVDSPRVLNNIPEIVAEFGGIDKLRSWFERLLDSKAFKAVPQKDRGKYIAKALKQEASLD